MIERFLNYFVMSETVDYPKFKEILSDIDYSKESLKWKGIKYGQK